MAVEQDRLSIWEALAGRAPSRPPGPADPDLWARVVERLSPAKARPKLRGSTEEAHLTTVRGVAYVMLRSPDDSRSASYVRLAPQEVDLAHLMDGSRTVSGLVTEFARQTGRLAPDQVIRVVADLAANRMLEELPVDAFRDLERVHRRPIPVRIGRGLLSAARGQRLVLGNVDRLTGVIYRFGGKLLFTRPAAFLMGVLALGGFVLFGRSWAGGGRSAFLTGNSYAAGGLVLLGLNVVALACHELGHALAAKHAGRRVPAAGVLIYFGMPSVFVDTTDVWMAGRRARLVTTGAGPFAALTLAGAAQTVALFVPGFGPLAFKLAFAWYLNSLFNLNPLMALDGYYLLMDWVEIPNLRARGIAQIFGMFRGRRFRLTSADRETRFVNLYGTASMLWLTVSLFLGFRVYSDRVRGLVLGLWLAGTVGRLLLGAMIAGLASPVVYALTSLVGRTVHRFRQMWREGRRDADAPRRLDALRESPLGKLSPQALDALASEARWLRPRRGTEVATAGAATTSVLMVVEGWLEGRLPTDPAGSLRARAGSGQLVGASAALTGSPSALSWRAAGTRLLGIPSGAFVEVVGPVAGQPSADQAEAEALFAESPALASIDEDTRLALARKSRAFDVDPEGEVNLTNPGVGVLVGSGALGLPDGNEFRRGQIFGPPAEGETMVAHARSRSRLWSLPVGTGLSLLLGDQAFALEETTPVSHLAPSAGVHPPSYYPPLDGPPGPPPIDDGGAADKRLRRGMRILLVVLLLLALLAAGLATAEGRSWAEMPGDQVLLEAERGVVEADLGEEHFVLAVGEQLFLTAGDLVRIRRRSLGSLTFSGGARVLLCGGTRAEVDSLATHQADPLQPSGALTLIRGKLIADTEGLAEEYAPLNLQLELGRHEAANQGAARFAAVVARLQVAEGMVAFDNKPVKTRETRLRCGGSGSSEQAAPGALPTGSVSPEASVDSSPTAEVSPNPSPNGSPKSSPEPTKPPPPSSSPSSSPTPEGDFALSCAQTVFDPSTGQNTTRCTLTSSNGFNQPVALSCAGLPASASCSFTPNPVTPTPGGANFTLTVNPGRVPDGSGCYNFNLIGNGGGKEHQVAMKLDMHTAGRPAC